MAKSKKIPLVSLYLFEWQQGRFSLNIDLSELVAALEKEFPKDVPFVLKADDTVTVAVFNDSGKKLGADSEIRLKAADLDSTTLSYRFDKLDKLAPGEYYAQVTYSVGDSQTGKKFPIAEKFLLNVPDQIKGNQPFDVDLKPTVFEKKPSEGLWDAIKRYRINFNELKTFVDDVLCKPGWGTGVSNFDKERDRYRLPFVNVDQYSLVKYAIDAYMRHALRLKDGDAGSYTLNPLPYYAGLKNSLAELLGTKYESRDTDCIKFREGKRNGFIAIELIWSYWTEQAMLVQAMNAVSLRYQNIRGLHPIEPMIRFDTSPLLPLSDILWGYIQDEQHRTTLHRRTFEYQHAYNLNLIGKAVPRQVGVDNRSRFLSTFHNLLHQAALFYKEYDDKTRNADAFNLLIALRDVHLLLTEGNHNAYYNMTYTTRHEMLTMQYLFSQPEMQVFLGGRPMMPVEPHVGVLDTIKTVQGWDPMGTMHYYDLANTGEQLLLSIRFGDWNEGIYTTADAGNWAIAFRDRISTYINAYRNVTMIDLSADSLRSSLEEHALQPSLLIQRRMQLNRSQARPARPFAASVA